VPQCPHQWLAHVESVVHPRTGMRIPPFARAEGCLSAGTGSGDALLDTSCSQPAGSSPSVPGARTDAGRCLLSGGRNMGRNRSGTLRGNSCGQSTEAGAKQCVIF
jgi:hypothetical protein